MTIHTPRIRQTANLLAFRPEMASSKRPLSQLDKLEALIAAATKALPFAARGALFDTPIGAALCNAAYDVFEVDGLYDMALDVDAPFGTLSK